MCHWFDSISSRSCPAELLHRQSGVPDLLHVPDPVNVEKHDMDVVRIHVPPGWWTSASLAGVTATPFR